MIVKLDTRRLQTLDQVGEFLAGSRPLDLQPETRAEAYAFVAETLQRFDYSRQGKADKGLDPAPARRSASSRLRPGRRPLPSSSPVPRGAHRQATRRPSP